MAWCFNATKGAELTDRNPPRRRGLHYADPVAPRGHSQRNGHMELHEAGEIMVATTIHNANEMLIQGWKLLAVSTTGKNGELHPCYVLGKREPSEKSPKKQTSASAPQVVTKATRKQ